jgi:acetolactate synthase-1/2/3 large subunit
VVNNRGYASIRASQANYFKLLTGCDETSGLKLPDLQALAKAYGLPAVGLDHRDDLRGKIREVLAMDGPALCEVVVAPDEPRIPRLASSQRKDGTMVSRPLEDLFPFLDREEFQQNMIVPPIPE